MERWLEGPLKRSVATNTYEDYAYRATEVRNPGARRYKAQCFTCKLGGLKARPPGLEPPTQGLACRLLQQRPLQQRLAPRSYYSHQTKGEPKLPRPKDAGSYVAGQARIATAMVISPTIKSKALIKTSRRWRRLRFLSSGV